MGRFAIGVLPGRYRGTTIAHALVTTLDIFLFLTIITSWFLHFSLG